jgi:hypothetical protein
LIGRTVYKKELPHLGVRVLLVLLHVLLGLGRRVVVVHAVLARLRLGHLTVDALLVLVAAILL